MKNSRKKETEEIEFTVYYGWIKKGNKADLNKLKRLSGKELEQIAIEIPSGTRPIYLYPDVLKEISIAGDDLLCDGVHKINPKRGRAYRDAWKFRSIVYPPGNTENENLV